MRVCRCTPLQREHYAGRISGPLLDRIDLVVDVPWVAPDLLGSDGDGEASAAIRARVVAARDRQAARFVEPGTRTNSELAGRAFRRLARPEPEGRRLLEAAVRRLSLSARAHDRILRVARTIADLQAVDAVSATHIAEALQYRATW